LGENRIIKAGPIPTTIYKITGYIKKLKIERAFFASKKEIGVL